MILISAQGKLSLAVAGLAAAMLFVFPFMLCTNAHASSTGSDSASPCALPEYRKFDFFAGDWDAYEIDNPSQPVARNRVTPILEGCVLLEDYQGTDGHRGQSFTIYDATRKVWHQTWVTNNGTLLTIEGNMQGAEMVLEGRDHTADGKELYVRGIWKPETGGVRETAVRSTDGGKTWSPWFDLMFRPTTTPGAIAPNPSQLNHPSADDKALVAGLDMQYQAAVKVNDAATMDRILADDFLLVTGSGKHYTKRDLLEEARSGRVQYEHQEDTEREVRVWGDMAVVTAKLWEKGTEDGKPFDRVVWFSDTYVRTPSGWRYLFAQSSLPLSRSEN